MAEALTTRENDFLRWLVGALLAIVALFGGVVWNRMAGQVDRHTEEIAAIKLQAQLIQSDAASDRRQSTASLVAIQQWLQAIGARLNVPQPPPATGTP